MDFAGLVCKMMLGNHQACKDRHVRMLETFGQTPRILNFVHASREPRQIFEMCGRMQME